MVWHNIVNHKLDCIWTCDVVDTDMKDYTDKAWIIIILICIVFWLLGCAKVEHKEEVKTYPLPEEDPILEKLIELNIVDVDESN